MQIIASFHTNNYVVRLFRLYDGPVLPYARTHARTHAHTHTIHTHTYIHIHTWNIIFPFCLCNCPAVSFHHLSRGPSTHHLENVWLNRYSFEEQKNWFQQCCCCKYVVNYAFKMGVTFCECMDYYVFVDIVNYTHIYNRLCVWTGTNVIQHKGLCRGPAHWCGPACRRLAVHVKRLAVHVKG